MARWEVEIRRNDLEEVFRDGKTARDGKSTNGGMSMTKKEFVSILRNIKAEWREIARRDPTAYHRGIVVDVGEDEAYIESLFECRGERVEEYQIVVQLEDGTYKIYFLVEGGYVSPAHDVWRVINENKLDWSYIV